MQKWLSWLHGMCQCVNIYTHMCVFRTRKNDKANKSATILVMMSVGTVVLFIYFFFE